MPKLSLPQKLERFPPVVIRLLAREKRGKQVVALSDGDVATRSGLTRGEVRTLSRFTNWDHVDLTTFMRFCSGCRADLDDRNWLRKNTQYMRTIRRLPRYLTRSPNWADTFEPLIRIWVRTQQ